MGNPYAARTWLGNEVTFPSRRLRLAGATAGEIDDARARYLALSTEERHDTIDALAALTDAELSEEIVMGRSGDGYPDTLLGVPGGAGTPPEAPDSARISPEAGAAGSGGLTDGTIGDVLARVGDSKARALETLREEQAGKNRTTLVRELRAILRR